MMETMNHTMVALNADTNVSRSARYVWKENVMSAIHMVGKWKPPI